ncbi:unnamed protein product [Wickerhamomyces anomalus]
MAADFWSSTQRMHWQFTRESLQETRDELKLLETTMEQSELVSKVSVQYDLYMRIYIHSLVNKLGRRLSVRQVALSTAEVYLMRFLTRVSLKEVNLYLLITTCIYLSCKIEECPQHIRTIVSEARNLWPESLILINEVLTNYNRKNNTNGIPAAATAPNDETTKSPSSLSPEELQSSWSIINDSYVTDLPLIFPPHIIAAASVYLTIVLKHNHLVHLQKEALKNSKPTPMNEELLKSDALRAYVHFLGHSNIDLAEVVEAVQEMITLYEVWESYDENHCKKPLESVLLNR